MQFARPGPSLQSSGVHRVRSQGPKFTDEGRRDLPRRPFYARPQSHPPHAHDRRHTVIEAYATLRRLIFAGNLRGWKGLSTLYLSDLTSTFPRDSDWTGTAQLGRSQTEAKYFWASVPGADEKLRVWFIKDSVILLDIACSRTFHTRPDDLASLLPEVPISLDTWRGTLSMPQSELVFPQHGLVAHIHREKRSIWHLALFQPQTLKDYVDNLRIDLRLGPHPPDAPLPAASRPTS